MNTKQNPYLKIDQVTFLQLKPIYTSYQKQIIGVFLKSGLSLVLCVLIWFVLGRFVGGVIGNTMAAIISIAAIPLSFNFLKKLSKSENLVKLQEYAKQMNTTLSELRRGYQGICLSIKPVPTFYFVSSVAFLIVGAMSFLYAAYSMMVGFGMIDVIAVIAVYLLPALFLVFLGVFNILRYRKQQKRIPVVLRIITIILDIVIALLLISVIIIYVNEVIFA